MTEKIKDPPKDKLSTNFPLSKEDTEDKENIDSEDVSDNEEDVIELGELKSTTNRKEPQPTISSKFKWSQTPPEAAKPSNTKSDKSYRFKPKLEAKNVTKPLDAWSLLFSDDILEIIVKYTNKKLKKEKEGHTTTVMEIRAFLGLLYFYGAIRDFGLDFENMWLSVYGYNFYRCIIPQERFETLLRFLCFDNVSYKTGTNDTKKEETLEQKLAPMKDIWDIFTANCAKYYSPSTHCTIGNIYLKFEDDSNKDKYIQIICLNDTETLYMINAEPYVGPVKTRGSESEQSYYIRKLSEPLHNTKRNIICNDWFTSVEIMEKMKKEYSLTMVGAISKKKVGDLPSFIKDTTSTRKPHFGYSNDHVLVAYSPNGCNVALLLSNFYNFQELNKANKLTVLSAYGWTKGRTKMFDKICRTYSTALKTEGLTNSWPLRLFFGMLDQAAINSFILYNLNKKNEAFDPQTFLKNLAFALTKPYLEDRLKKKDVTDKYIRIIMREILSIKTEIISPTKLTCRACCYLCLQEKNKTLGYCRKCKYPICGNHGLFVCASTNCAEV